MGPLRRGLILSLIPTASFAEVCQYVRPMWDVDKGAVTIWTEPLYTFANPILMLLVLAVLPGSFFRPIAFQVLGVISATFLLMFTSTRLWAADTDGIWALARAEGCIAPPYLSAGFAAIVAAFAIIRAIRRIRKPRV